MVQLTFEGALGKRYSYKSDEKKVNDYLSIWKKAGYKVEGNKLVKRIEKVILYIPAGRYSRAQILSLAPPEKIEELIGQGKIVVRRVAMPRYVWVRRRGRLRRVLRFREVTRYFVEKDIVQKEEDIDEIDIIEIPFHVYPTGRYVGKKKREIAVRILKIIRIGARPPKGMSVEEVLEKLDFSGVEDELIDAAIEALKENHPAPDKVEFRHGVKVRPDSGWWEWEVLDDLGREIDFNELGKRLVESHMEETEEEE